ncbi:hypothetical protein AMS68_002135 [Peltaster fructicola]|uniref:Vacuolar membrane PQ loop repeat protein n=1 Tax=Peltaster fructicola TaxID=286661 RepID=A0A6H0XPQ9_9PEZI|nr:hypothetical protein AMS68_002135 [Peltaster fructicola]
MELTWNEALSGVFGSISLAAWIFLLVPQLIENYQHGSADGISITFILIWAAGDAFNLAGALWAGLVPTVIALAVYFCFADGILILQCWYYSVLKRRRLQEEEQNGHVQEPTEASPLLNGNAKSRNMTDVTPENLGLPGSRRRSSAASRRTAGSILRRDTLVSIKEESPSRTWLKNAVSVFAILAAGAAGWAVAYKTGAWQPSPVGDDRHRDATPIGAEVLGYISAVLYLGARIPQIIKNQRERSCEGLSLLFFILSVIGNASYGAGILFHSVEKDDVLTNLPWLIGSLGTMVEDAIIFAQFSAFGEKEEGLGEPAVA